MSPGSATVASPKVGRKDGLGVGPEAVAEFSARHRFAQLTARKARLIADMIRGRPVNQALELLQFAPQRGASFYLKVVRSAIANASLDADVNVNRLYIFECRADDGPLLNGRMRFRPGPQGRAMPFAKRLSHLTVKVRELPTETLEGTPALEEATSVGKAAGKKASGKKASSRKAPASAKKPSAKKPAAKKPTAKKPAAKKKEEPEA